MLNRKNIENKLSWLPTNMYIMNAVWKIGKICPWVMS